MNYWLVKQEPETYPWAQFVADAGTAWTGVRNFAARNFLRAMRVDDRALYYHTGEEKQIVGLAQVVRAAYADATAEEGDWSAVDLAPVKALTKPVTLATIKADPLLQALPLVKQSRLSVSPVSKEQFLRLLELAETRA